jgi:hypothetical protein
MIKNEVNGMMDRDSRSIHYSCRLDTEIYRFLADEAEQKNVSMNNMLNQVAREHVVKKNFEKIGSALTCKDALRGVFDMANDKQLIKLATKLGSNNAVDYVGMLYHDINKDTVLRFLDLWGGRFYGYEHKNHDGTHQFSISHDVNEKYSVFTKEFIMSFVDSAINTPVKIQSSPRMVTFSLAV